MITSAIATLCFTALAAVVLYDTSRRSRGIAAIIFAYLAGFTGFAVANVFVEHAAGFPPLAIRVMTGFLALLVALLAMAPTRAALLSIPSKSLVMWHSVRLPIGLVFIAMANAGQLAPEFGQIAGWGDVVIGLWAIAYVCVPVLRKPLGTSMFNAAAFAEMAFGVALATLTLSSPMQLFPHADLMVVMNTFPLVLVIGFAVPILWATNFLLFRQVRITMGCSGNCHRRTNEEQKPIAA